VRPAKGGGDMANSRGGDFMAGLLLGGVVGAALGLLLAPQSGDETRQFLKEKSGELKDRARERSREWADKAKEQVSDLTAKVKEQAGEAMASGREALKEKKEKLISSLHRGPDEETTEG
jgi:gas vesicle protein